MGTLIGIIFGIILIGAIFVYNTLTWGLVLHKFWFWFMLPVFPEMPVITFVQALGLMFVIGLFKNQTTTSVKKQYKNEGETAMMLLLMPWTTLFFGWLAYIIWLA